ncbi:intradiol ring-cleavage dioxygenase [Pyxidicoccus fallax]|uniref:Intradiol ring-cleavage dioxygenase n=1 Tax=Pyxidicoccus fallax TaxID=394095 RepID=A0A848LIE7_9BACT|nr:intradiol ring-cleavage dioxygenase [Pyxidicoccus fallax]NMO17497.1 intradiol ring-cleavage dioxygenase [Pyxidicoccus fallax]NPC79624.1 intradiol ring-cleavage dioxygenase [Pyxidicoccus fallax]
MHEHDDGGLQQDLKLLRASMERRTLLRLALGASLVPLVGCGGGDSSGTGTPTPGGATGNGACATIPTETAGPYPGDGSNGPNVLTQTGIVRSDIRTSVGTGSATAGGVPLTVTLTLVNSAGSCEPLVGYAIYLWHCDREGRYSLYSSGVTDQNYLRGVQETDEQGRVTFTTIFPGCYSGRWPHIHFEVYPSLASATKAGNKIATSQLALPKAACDEAYATSGYSSSVSNLQRISLSSDNVFRDGSDSQLATVTGSATEGYVSTLTVAIAA